MLKAMNYVDNAIRKMAALGQTQITPFMRTWADDLHRLAQEQKAGVFAELAKGPSSEGVNVFFAGVRDKMAIARADLNKPIDIAKGAGRQEGSRANR